MIHLTRDGAAILALRPHRPPLVIAIVDPRRILAALVAQGWRVPVAAAVSAGELTAEAAVSLARESGLVEGETQQ